MHEGMDLKEFVKSVMRDLSEAFMDHLRERPREMDQLSGDPKSEYLERFGDVDFDVAVTTTTADGKSQSGGIKVLTIFQGEKGSTEDVRRELASHIRFTIRSPRRRISTVS